MSRSRQIALTGLSYKSRSLASHGFLTLYEQILDCLIKVIGKPIAAKMPNIFITNPRFRR